MSARLISIHKAAPEDQRAFKRHPVELSILVRPIREDEPGDSQKFMLSPQRTALVKDLSMTGLCFISPTHYPIGSLVEIQMNLGTKLCQIQALVRRTQVQELPGRSAYSCAVQFVRCPGIDHAIPAIAMYLSHRYKSAQKPDGDVNG